MSFSLSEVIHMISTIDDLLWTIEHPYTMSVSTGYDVQNNHEIEFIKFSFPLNNGISHVKLYDSVGVMTYENKAGEVLKNIEFGDMYIVPLNGSFKKGFKQIREFDRQQPSTAKNNNSTQIDRASFGLAEEVQHFPLDEIRNALSVEGN